MQRPISDWGGNILGFLLVIAVNILSNALPINGQSDLRFLYGALFTSPC